jgi:hypothetical protein
MIPPLEAELRERLKKRPFEPFRITLKDGRRFDISNPRLNTARIKYFDIGVPSQDDPEWLRETWIPVSYDDIVQVETLPSVTATR